MIPGPLNATSGAPQGAPAPDRPTAALPVKGPVRILCDEIGFPWDRRLEREDLFVAFVRVLVEGLAEDRELSRRIVRFTGRPPSDGSQEVLSLAFAMLDAPDTAGRIARAAAVHDASHRLNPDNAYPTDHLIDMLASCASAIRFGLAEREYRSRHAASAADHVWRHRYGVSRFDGQTPAWENEWARSVLMSAIISLLPSLGNAEPGEKAGGDPPCAPDRGILPGGHND